MQILTQTDNLNREKKTLRVISSAFFEKLVRSFETLNSTFYAKQHYIFCYKMRTLRSEDVNEAFLEKARVAE